MTPSNTYTTAVDDTIAPSGLFEHTAETICSFADFTLLVSEADLPEEKLDVSSHILGMASPVFRTLFSKKFAEGQKEEGKRKQVKIEDHPSSLKTLCRILHHLPPQTKTDKTPIDMLGLAIVADKYDCVEVLRLSSRALFEEILQPHRDGTVISHKVHDLVAAAYILDQPTVFRYLTGYLVLHEKSIQAEDFTEAALDHLPAKAIASLNKQCTAARNELAHHISELVSGFCKAAGSLSATHLIPLFLSPLQAKGLLPMNPNDKQIDIATYLSRLESVNVPILQTSASLCTCQHFIEYLETEEPVRDDIISMSLAGGGDRYHHASCGRGYKGSVKHIQQHHVRLVGQNIRDVCVGICLDCLKNDNKAEYNCRLEHAKPWKHDRPGLIEYEGLKIDSFADWVEIDRVYRRRGRDASFLEARKAPDWWESMW